MKIYDLFTKEELEYLEEIEYHITKRDYSFEEINDMKRNCSYMEQKKVAKDIEKKLLKVENTFPEKFNYQRWKREKTTSAKELKKFLKDLNIVGKKIVNIMACGTSEFLAKANLVNYYNNNEDLAELPNWTRMKTITKEYIVPEIFERGRVESLHYPLVITFDDGTNLEIISRKYGTYEYSVNKIKEKEKYVSEIDLNKMFGYIIGLKIDKVNVTKGNERQCKNWGVEYTGDVPDWIELWFDNGKKLVIYCLGMTIMRISDNWVDTIGYEEYKSCVKHFDWLFSKEARPRFVPQPDEPGVQLSETEKQIIELLHKTKERYLDIVNTMTLVNAMQKEEELLKWLISRDKKGKISELTESDILKKILSFTTK